MAKSNIDKDDIKNIQDYNKALNKLKELQDEANKTALEVSAVEKLNKLAKERLDISKELITTENNIRDLTDDVVKDLKIEATARVAMLKAREKELDIQEAILDTNSDLYKQIQQIKKVEEDRYKFAQKYSGEIEKQLGFLDSIDDVIKEIPVVGGVLSKALGLDNIKKELSEKMLGAFTSGLQGATTGAGGLMAGLRGAAVAAKGLLVSMGPLLPIALALAAAFVALERAFEIDEEVTNLAKNLDVSKHAAHEIHHTAIGIAKEMKTVGINSGEVLKVMEEMNTSMGFNVGLMAEHNQIAKDLVKTTTLLVEKQGLSTEEAVSFQRVAIATNIPIENLAVMSKSMGDELMSGREIMQDLGKVSKGVLINFSKNPIALVKAVKQAKLLGTTLDDINGAGKSLLDIESSIGKEMEARVLTGKNINLNQARYYAMTGETEKLMSEIAKQTGSVAEYEKMLPMQRKALAEAMGMNLEQMDSMMLKQKELETLGYTQTELQEKLALSEGDRTKELNKLRSLGKEDAANMLAAKYAEEDRVAANKKLADIGKKIMDIFDKIVSGPLGEMVNDLLDMVTTSESISVITKGIGAAFYYLKAIALDAFMPIRIAFNTLTGIYKFLTGDFMGAWEDVKDIVDAILAPFKAIISGVKFVTGIKGSEHSNNTTSSSINKADDFIMRPGQAPLTFNKDDLIIGGTNLFGNQSTNGTAGNDPQIAEMIGLLKQLIATTSGPTVIKIGSRTIEELDSQIGLRKNYNTIVDSSYGTRT